MALVLTESDVKKVLTMRDGVRLVEEGFRHYASQRTTLAPRLVMKLEGDAGNFRIMAAVVPDMGGFGLKTLTGTPGKRDPASTYFAVLYFDVTSGALLAVLPGAHLTGIRTGAASGVATKHLAREDAKTLGLLGAGFQGRHQVTAVREVRPIERVKIFDVESDAAQTLAADLAREGLEAIVTSSPEETIRGSAVVAAATTSKEPAIKGAWLEPGQHVNTAGANAPFKREVDAEAFARTRVVVDFREQVREEAGDLIDAVKSGAFSEDQIYAELGEIVTGAKRGRGDESQITLFKSVGVAIEDVAVAAFVYDRARAEGLGTDIDLSS